MEEQDKNITQVLTLITTNAKGYPFFIFHKAVKYKDENNTDKILHFCHDGIEILDYEKFMEGRKIYKEKTYKCTKYFNAEEYAANYKKPFHWAQNNCEDFASQVINDHCGKQIRITSPQTASWVGLLAIESLLVAYLIYKMTK